MTEREKFSVERYDGGISVIDAGFHREKMAGCYMMEADSEVAFIEVGTNSSTPRLLQTLEESGWRREEVRYVIVTHVHLDHAGGAGSLMQALPNATLLVHPYGARHMIDPAKLEAGARAVYGDDMFDRIYGELVAVPEERTRIMDDGSSVKLGNRELRFIDTPGHARHHFCVHDSLTNGWFTGDTFGLSYREFDTEKGAFILPTTTPIQFDPEPLKASVRRLMECAPDYMYLTHYGRVADVGRLAGKMIDGVDQYVAFAERYDGDGNRREKIETAMYEWLMSGLREHGVTLSESRCAELLMADIQLNTAGIEIWLDHRKR
jgi:glyoxylase-like metal-dependent hydrolase (beta-lactamase superfamily II)